MIISIHALREEGDQNTQTTASYTEIFLSTPSARRATDRCRNAQAGYRISIHALREEGDGHGIVAACITDDISIHALREEGDVRPCPP